MLHVGVDEAGYGPLLGPLVVGVAAFRLTDHPEPGGANLLKRLRGLVVRRPRDAKACGAKRLPVPVDDSNEFANCLAAGIETPIRIAMTPMTTRISVSDRPDFLFLFRIISLMQIPAILQA